jgi:thiamine-phosphate pyrophosphorylase
MNPSNPLRGLYAITDTELLRGPGLVPGVEAALRGGARVIQYRDKGGDAARRRHEVEQLLAVCRRFDAPLLINDDWELALATGADGVHLGAEDPRVAQARDRLGRSALIGASCYASLELAHRRVREGATYVAFGSLYPSPTKPDSPLASLSLLTEAKRVMDVPICAIGGITAETIDEVVDTGADLIAVVSSVFAASDIEAATRSLVERCPGGAPTA